MDINYTVPGPVLGKIAEFLIVERVQEHSTEQTLENLKVMAEAK